MSQSPADEYDLRLASRRRVLVRVIVWTVVAAMAAQAAAGGLFAWALAEQKGWIAQLSARALVVFVVLALASLGVSLWNWRVLPARWMLLSAAPWAVFVVEVTFVAVMWFYVI